MNKLLKKIFIVVLSILAACAYSAVAACSSCDGEPGKDDSELSFTLNYHLKSLSIYESLELKVNGFDNVEWSSNNENVASVKNGTVTANSYGSAIITATEGDLSDTCIINVPDENLVPYIKVNVDDSGLSMLVGDEYSIKSFIRFNNKDYSDATFGFTTSNEDIISINSNGVVYAKKTGNTIITINGSWREFDSKQLVIYIPVSVNSDVSMDLSVKDKEIFTRSCVIDDVIYSNSTTLSYTVLIDGQDKTSSLEVVWKTLNPDIVTLNGTTVTAKNRGKAEIYYECNVGGKIYTSLPVTVTVNAPLKTLDELVVYKIGEGCISNSLFEGTPYSIKLKAADYTDKSDFNAEGIFIDADSQKGFKGRETNFTIDTETYSYSVNVLFVTHAISTKDEFISFLSSYSGNNPDTETNVSNTYYAVLTADIDLQGTVLPSKSYNGDRFFGKFNGLGHSLINPTVNATGGIFGGLQNCTIENFALLDVNVTKTYSSYALLAGYLYPGAKVSNVYVKTTIDQLTFFRGLFYSQTNGSLSNIIAQLEYASSNKAENKYVFGVSDFKNKMSHVFAIGNATAYYGVWDAGANEYIPDTQGFVYPDFEEFFNENCNEICTENGFSKYWVKTDDSLKFGSLLVYSDSEDPIVPSERVIDETVVYEIGGGCIPNSLFEGTPYAIKLKSVDYTNKTEFKDDGICIDAELQNELKGSEVTFVVQTELYSYSVNILFVTHAISTKDGFIAFLNSYSGNNPDTETNVSNTYYAVLTADIDLTGTELPSKSYNGDRFFGKFNGLGHTLLNPTVNATGGIFGGLQNCTIENFALLDVSVTRNSAYSALIAGYLYPGAKVNNIYVKATIDQPSFFRGVFYSPTNGSISNIIANIEYSSKNNAENKYVFGLSDLKKNLSCVYVVGNATAYYGVRDVSSNAYVPDTQGVVYSDFEKFYNEISAENGFSKYWIITENSLKFGDLVIYSK